MIVANLLHLSYNMWGDWENPAKGKYWCARPYMRFDEKVWNDLLVEMAKRKFNMVVIDLGDAVQYQSRPEIAIKGAWSPEKLKGELKKMREMGLEPIPKLNFSACHDQWLGKYARMVSTAEYYAVVADLIKETCDLFDKPRYFHLGMDEEEPHHQEAFEYVVSRRFDLWWKDILNLFDQTRAKGVTPWIWSDYVWNHTAEFYRRMPKDVMQSNWYRDPVRGDAKSVYGAKVSMDVECCKTYVDLDKAGYEQIPTVSNWETPANIPNTIKFCQETCSKERLKGYILTPWRPTLEETRATHMDAIEHMAMAIEEIQG